MYYLFFFYEFKEDCLYFDIFCNVSNVLYVNWFLFVILGRMKKWCFWVLFIGKEVCLIVLLFKIEWYLLILEDKFVIMEGFVGFLVSVFCKFLWE